jgi:hypothetical protein
MCGGFYLRWRGKGVVINPGTHFLENFHQLGLFVKDIDYVIVSRDNIDAYADVKGIYDLNCQHNSVSNQLHVIEYYLNQKAYNNIATALTPRFKQERNTVHCLDMYIDSPEVETVSLGDKLRLQYFHTSSTEVREQGRETASTNLGLRLELLPELEGGDSLSLGFVSGLPWSSLLGEYLSGCSLVISGFENTNADDYSKIKYNDDSLGYYGTYSLVKEVQPALLLCSDFSGREGDVRMEVVKKLHQELSGQSPTVVLPGDTGLYLDLQTSQIQCSVCKTLVDPSKVRVAKSSESFGHLHYLSPSCFI